jgi:hypothetical protein
MLKDEVKEKKLYKMIQNKTKNINWKDQHWNKKLIKGQLKFIDWRVKLNQSNIEWWNWK